VRGCNLPKKTESTKTVKATSKTTAPKELTHKKRLQSKKEKEVELLKEVDMYTKLTNKILKSLTVLIVGVGGVITTVYVVISNINNQALGKQQQSQSSLENRLVDKVTLNSERIDFLMSKTDSIESTKVDKLDYIKVSLDEEFRKIRNNQFDRINVESIRQIESAMNSGLLDKEPSFILSTAQYVTRTYREHMFYKSQPTNLTPPTSTNSLMETHNPF
jgi:hypothetical protein